MTLALASIRQSTFLRGATEISCSLATGCRKNVADVGNFYWLVGINVLNELKYAISIQLFHQHAIPGAPDDISNAAFFFFLFLTFIYIILTPWLMEPGGSMLHSQGLSNNPYPEPNQLNFPH